MRKLIIATVFLFAATFAVQTISAQEADGKQLKIKITQTINGETTITEEIFESEDAEELKELLEKFDLKIDPADFSEKGYVEINIKKSFADAEDENVVMNFRKEVVFEPKGFLGLFIVPVKEGEEIKKGVSVVKAEPGSAAEKAGFISGDIITKVNKEEITDTRQFRELIASFKPGEEITITYVRDEKKKTVTAVLDERKPMPNHHFHEMHSPAEIKMRPFLGVVAGKATDSGEAGVMIEKVIEGSTAAEIGLQENDVITKINNTEVKNFHEMVKAIDGLKAGEKVEVQWLRDGKEMNGAANIYSMKMAPPIKKYNGHHDWEEKLKMKFEENEEELKTHIEKKIERMEKKIVEMKEYLKEIEIEKIERKAGDETTTIQITIEDVKENSFRIDDLRFSPNPNDGKFKLSFDLSDKGKTLVRIFDVNNKEIFTEDLGKFSGRYEKEIDLSEKSKGIYFLQIEQNGKFINKKIVVQ